MTSFLPADEARLCAEAIVDAVPQSLLILDADLRVLGANRAFHDTFGVQAADIEQRLLVELGGRQWNVPRLLELLRGVIQRNETFDEFEVETDIPTLGPRVMLLGGRPIGSGPGRPARILLIIEDVTEPRRREQNVRRLQRIETIGLLAGGVAHDFSNLLTVITGRVEILLRRLGAASPHTVSLGVIRDTALRAAEMTKQLLAFSRQQILAPRVLDLGQVVRDLEPRLRDLVPGDVELTIVLKSSASILADPGQLEHVLVNLVTNAKDAMPTGGRVRIETADTRLDAAFVRDHAGAQAGPVVLLAVADTGVGMSAEVQSRIFEPFFTTKTKGKGTGLGLATVYGVVEQSGGSVWVDSTPGQGTTVKVYFPLAAEPADAGAPASHV